MQKMPENLRMVAVSTPSWKSKKYENVQKIAKNLKAC